MVSPIWRYVSACTTPSEASTRVEARRSRNASRWERAGLGGEEADRERLRKARQRDVVGHILAERLQECDLDQVDADSVPHEIGHLAAGDPRGDLDYGDSPIGSGDELGEGDRVREAERERRVDGDAARRARSCSGGIEDG